MVEHRKLCSVLRGDLNGSEIPNRGDVCTRIPVHRKGNQLWMFIGRTDAEAEAPTLWPPDVKSWLIGKDPDAGKDWGREGDDRGWDCLIASLTQWTWVWANSGRQWGTGRSGVLHFMGSKRIRHDLASEQQQIADFLWYGRKWQCGKAAMLQ